VLLRGQPYFRQVRLDNKTGEGGAICNTVTGSVLILFNGLKYITGHGLPFRNERKKTVKIYRKKRCV